MGLILPSHCERGENSDVDKLRVYLDSSGSMKDDDYNIFVSIVAKASKFFPKETTAYEFNTKVTKMKCIHGKIIGKPKTTGGTNISCVCKHISKLTFRSKTLNIIITDGYFNWKTLYSFMTKEDKQSKFLFIITGERNDRYDNKRLRRRLKVIFTGDTNKVCDLRAIKWE